MNGMNDYIYIGQVEADGDFTPVKAFFTEESAREWMREEFLEISKENGIPKDEWEWDEGETVLSDVADYKWACFSRNTPDGIRVWRVKASAGDSHEVYVCQTTDSEGTEIDGLYFSEDTAREWMRREFVKFRIENDADNSEFFWNYDAEIWWYCGYEPERMDWEIFRLPLPE